MSSHRIVFRDDDHGVRVGRFAQAAPAPGSTSRLTWVEDASGSPLAMAHRSKGWVGLLLRPDSLASAPQAAQALAHALAVLKRR